MLCVTSHPQPYDEAAQLADAAGMEPIAYEFFERAMTIYEDEISDSQAQKLSLSIIVGTLQRCVAFTPESRDSLVHKATGYSARLLKKPDQCVAVAACSHLFWGPVGVDGAARDADSVVVCLKKSLKIASAAQQAASTTGAGAGAALSLFITVLNKYLYFLDQGCPSVTLNVLQGLLEARGGEGGKICQVYRGRSRSAAGRSRSVAVAVVRFKLTNKSICGQSSNEAVLDSSLDLSFHAASHRKRL